MSDEKGGRDSELPAAREWTQCSQSVFPLAVPAMEGCWPDVPLFPLSPTFTSIIRYPSINSRSFPEGTMLSNNNKPLHASLCLEFS